MIVSVNITVPNIVDECNMQTSLDLQAMRARGVETANAVYDDWVMTEDDMKAITYALRDITSNMAFALRTIIKAYTLRGDVISVDLENDYAEEGEETTLYNLVSKYMRHSLLAWWYHYRDAELSTRNEEAANVTLNNIFTQCLPRTGSTIGRYF